MATAGMSLVGDVLLAVQTRADPTDHEIDRMLEAIRKRPSEETLRMLVVSAGGASTGLQREAIIEVIGKRKMRVAVVTSSTAARGNATALGWFVDGMKSFPPEQFEDVCRYLGLSSAEMKLLESAYSSIRRDLSHDPSLPVLRLSRP
jgi:hypothetical protein